MSRLHNILDKMIDQIEDKQDILVSGETVKEVNGESILGEGDLETIGTGELSTESQNIIGAINELDSDMDTLNTRVTQAEAAVGAPRVASTVASMTDTTKVYVYTGSETGYTAGNWYYYNGSSWVSGGVYNSFALETDTTLTEAGEAADAKAVGDEITNVKSALDKSCSLDTKDVISISSGDDLNNYKTPGNYIAETGSIANSVLHKPDSVSSAFRLEVARLTNTSRVLQTIISINNEIYFRTITDNIWSDWAKINDLSFLEKVFTLDTGMSEKYIGSGDDLNTYTTPGDYYAKTGTIAKTLLNKPKEVGNTFRLTVFNYSSDGRNRIFQCIFSGAYNTICVRSCVDNTWYNWFAINSMNHFNRYAVLSDEFLTEFTNGDDLNNYKSFGSYVARTADMANSLQHLPKSNIGAFRMDVIWATASDRLAQIVSSNYGTFYRVYWDGTWGEWEENANKAYVEQQIKKADISHIRKGVNYSIALQAKVDNYRKDYESTKLNKWYGVEWIEGESGVTRINSDGDGSLHTSLPIQSKMKRCVVKNGSVQYWLNPSDSTKKEDGTKADLTGEDGNVCVRIPDFFFKFEESSVNGKRKVALKLSETYLPGFSYSPEMYCGAYEATINRSINKLVSVATTVFDYTTQDIMTHIDNFITDDAESTTSRGTHKVAQIRSYAANAANYRGCNNNSKYDSITDASNPNYWKNNLGRPVARIGEKKLNELSDMSNGEFIYLYDAHKALWMLSMVEFPTRNIQNDTTGLGYGATTWPSYDAFKQWCIDDTESILPCGITNALGNNSGTVYIKAVNVPISVTGAYPNADPSTFVRGNVWIPCMSYRGVEHYYGHLYKMLRQVKLMMRETENTDPNTNKRIDVVSYYYSQNPYLSEDDDLMLIARKAFAPSIVNTYSYIFGHDGHILPQASTALSYTNEATYCDCTEFNYSSTYKDELWPITTNGSLINLNLPGRNMLVVATNGFDTNPRTSNGTRLTCVGVYSDDE